MDDPGRRQFLAATGAIAGLVGLAGCYRPDTSDVTTLSPEETATPTREGGDGGASTPAAGGANSADLDLREANVVDVAVQQETERTSVAADRCPGGE